MADAVDETEKLFARANAAIAEAARLAKENYVQRKSLSEGIRLMRFNAVFYPKGRRFYSATDFLFRLGPPGACSNEPNANGPLETGRPIFDSRADSSD